MPSNLVQTIRDEISNLWHKEYGRWCNQLHYGFVREDHYFAFAVSKDWLQDTTEALSSHRRRGFVADPVTGYIEYLGVLQATFIQQDAICELHYALSNARHVKPTSKADAWTKLRDLRNLTAGHPTLKDRPKAEPVLRSSIRRQTMTYDHINFTVVQQSGTSHETLDLGKLLDEYDQEAGSWMTVLFEKLKDQLKQAAPSVRP